MQEIFGLKGLDSPRFDRHRYSVIKLNGVDIQSALVDKAGCMACHNVAAKYKGQDVQATLISKIKEGGRGTWGVLPMPPNAGKLSDEEFQEVVQWIISL